MERTLKIGFVTFLGLYFCYLVVSQIPAQWLALGVNKAVPQMALGSVQGTLWQGEASARIGIADQNLDLGAVAWTIDPLAMLGLNLCITLRSEKLSGTFCRAATGAMSVSNALVDQVPMKLFQKQLPVEVSGHIAATVQQAKVDSTPSIKALEANVSWQRARVNAGDGWYDIGSYGATLSAGAQGGVKAAIVDLEGPFVVAVDAEVNFDGTSIANGSITPKGEAPPPLVTGLSMLTQKDDNGAFRVVWPPAAE